ncbi:hypothetical protein BGX26_000730 [Mortierella sp. AD094]|nr:hypothetical protein BGX26_000730 [Mortierella sp. AD094]
MPDLTNIFRATVQDLDQASGNISKLRANSTNAANQHRPDPWIKEAHQIYLSFLPGMYLEYNIKSRTMSDLRVFIITTRPAYLNISRGTGSSGISGSGRLPRRSDSIPKNNNSTSSSGYNTITSSKVLNDLLETVSSLTSLSDKDRDSIDTQAKVMMRQIKGAIEELESLEQERRKRQQNYNNASVSGFNQLLNAAAQLGSSSGTVDDLAQHRQGVTLYLNERLASLATLHKDQYETRIAREMEKRESYGLRRNDTTTAGSLASGGSSLSQRRNQGSDLLSNNGTSSPPSPSHGPHKGGSNKPDTSGISSSQYYQQQSSSSLGSGFVDEEQDFEGSLTEQERQMLQLENENIVQKLETELNQVRQLESSMMELSSLHSTIQEHLEAQTLQTNRLHEEAQTAINHIDAGNDQLIKAGKHNKTTRKWVLFFLIMASFVLLFLDWYD